MQLEALPAEIRCQLLFTLEYEALKTLVHASPIYHEQYLLDRYHLLYKCLETALGSPTMVTDAFAVKESGRLRTRTNKKVVKFLKAYWSRYPSCADLSKGLPLDEVVSMVAFHFSIIKPLVSYYSGREINCLAESPRPLSNTEETRIVRALYRFQLYCNLFGVGRSKNHTKWLDFYPDGIMRLFLNVFEPWEVEEIACIHNFAKWEVDRFFKRISLDVYSNSKLDIAANDTLVEGTTSRGLKLLHTILFKTKDHAQLIIMQNPISPPRGHSIEHVLYAVQGLDPSDPTLEKQQERGPTPFQGDHSDLPPLAWTIIWQAVCSDHRDWGGKGGLRYWGYVMWDAARLERTRGKKRLIQNWEEYLQIYRLGDIR